MGIRRCLGLFGPLVALVGLLLLPNPTSAEEPLSISISSSRETCTVGTLTDVSWRISGGTAPYEVAVNGVAVDPDAASERVLCALAEGLTDPSQLYAFERTVIRATVTDASNQGASDSLVLPLTQPFPPPRRAFAGAGQEWSDYRFAGLYAGVNRHFAEDQYQAPPPSLFLFRWRQAGSNTWTYHSHDESTSDSFFSQQLHQHASGTRYEVQISQLRDPIERETPDALRWTRTLTAISDGPPNDVTVRTSGDSAVVSWRANRTDTYWRLTLEDDERAGRGYYASETQVVKGQHSYRVEFDNLRPEHDYSISLQNWSGIVLPEATFDIRTGPERTDASRAYAGPVITSVYQPDGRDVIAVEWEAPLLDDDIEVLVYAYEFGTPIDYQEIRRVKSDQNQLWIANVRPGTLYRVVVAYDDLHRTRDEVFVETRARFEDVRTNLNRETGISELFVDWRGTANDDGIRNTFIVKWEPALPARYAQVQWQTRGRTMHSFGAAPIVIQVAHPGSYRFRSRLRVKDQWTDWTPWQYRSTTPVPPSHYSIQAYEQDDQWHIEWNPVPYSLTPADGYRVYLTFESGEEVEFDAGTGTRLSIPMPARGNPVGIQIASYHRQYGTGHRSRTVTISPGAPPELHFARYYNDYIMCDPYSGLPAAIPWEVRGGVAPFFIAVGNREAYETSEREGIEIVPCELPPDDDEPLSESVVISLVDARSRTSTLTREIRHAPLYGDEQDRSVPVPQARVFSVDEREAHLGWPCHIWSVLGYAPRPPLTFLLRWRWSGSGAWQYQEIERGSPGYESRNQCRWVWPDLRPGTRYEFQLAYRPFFDDGSEPKEWSTVSSFTTLEDVDDARIERTEGRVSVSWTAQPDAWLYLVRLQGPHESWWRLHRPSGDAVETAVLDDVPEGAELTVEITSPPRFRGETLFGPGYQVFIPPH